MALESLAGKVTPPGSILNAPPTPLHTDTKPSSRVAKILQIFRDCKNGIISESPWRVFELASDEYDELLDCLEREELKEFIR
jgi:hypothetical protein